MIVTCVYIHVNPDAVQRFLEAQSKTILNRLKNLAIFALILFSRSNDPCQFMLYEAYESDEAAATHKNTVHYIKWRDTVKDFMVEPRKGVKYNIIEPNDKRKW